MIHHWKSDAAQYPALHNGKEYILYVREDGTGACVALQDAWRAIASPGEDRLLALLNILASPGQQRRAEAIEEEFSYDVQLPSEVTGQIWRVWTLTKAACDKESDEIEAEIKGLCEWLDKALQPILAANL